MGVGRGGVVSASFKNPPFIILYIIYFHHGYIVMKEIRIR